MDKAKQNELIRAGFEVYNASDQPLTGQGGSVVTRLIHNGAVASEPVSVSEIVATGQYEATFTPLSLGIYDLTIDKTGIALDTRIENGGRWNVETVDLDDLNINIDANETKIDAVKAETALIVEDTGTTLPATLSTMDGKLDTIQADLDDPNQYKADVSALALEATAQLIKTETDKIQTIDDNVDAIKLKTDLIKKHSIYGLMINGYPVLNVNVFDGALIGFSYSIRNLEGTQILIADISNAGAITIIRYRAGTPTVMVGAAAMTKYNGYVNYPYSFSISDWQPDDILIVSVDGVVVIKNGETFDLEGDAIASQIVDDDPKTVVDAIKVDTAAILVDTTAIKAKTDNLPDDIQAELDRIKALVGDNIVIEFTFAGDNNSAANFYAYDTKANAQAHIKGSGLQTGGLFEWSMAGTFIGNYPDVIRHLRES